MDQSGNKSRIKGRAGFGFLAVVVVFGSLFFFGCASPRDDVAERMDGLRERWETNVLHQANLEERELDWNEAVEMMLGENLQLRQARDSMVSAREQVRQLFMDLLPTLNMRSGVSKRLGDLDTMSVDDITFSADSFLNLPGFVSFGARLYAARLNQLRAEAAYELARRERIIDLYRAFIGAESTVWREEDLKEQRETVAAMTEVDPFRGRLMETQLEVNELGLAREEQSLQSRMSQLLGSREYRWNVRPETVPELPYAEEPLPLTDTNRVAQLQLKMMAIELEAARAALTGIKLRYWPEMNVSLSAPPIYRRAFGESQFWDLANVRANANVFWFVDTRGQIRRQLRQTKRQQALQRQRLDDEAVALIDRLLFTQRLLEESVEKVKRVEYELVVLRAVPPSQNYNALQNYGLDFARLIDQRQSLRREIAELQTLFWFMDEAAWAPEGNWAVMEDREEDAG